MYFKDISKKVLNQDLKAELESNARVFYNYYRKIKEILEHCGYFKK